MPYIYDRGTGSGGGGFDGVPTFRVTNDMYQIATTSESDIVEFTLGNEGDLFVQEV